MAEEARLPGKIVLFGSGETAPSGRKAFEEALRGLPPEPRIAVLETPAGFELNSARVAGRVAEFIEKRLQNYNPRTYLVAARRRGTPFSTDEPEIVKPLLDADLIFMGPGSPTYAVRQLCESLAWEMIQARHRLGAPLVLASAAAIACSVYALPVYEIYKVGEDVHWKEGLDLFGAYGLRLVFIPHWNNNDGGAELDTSRCFMGQARFAPLVEMLPPDLTIVGIDEKTALLVDPASATCRVTGLGEVTLIHTGHKHPLRASGGLPEGAGLAEVAAQRGGHVHRFAHGEKFPIHELGAFRLPEPGEGITPETWQQAQAQEKTAGAAVPAGPPPEVEALVAARQEARASKDWPAADSLRRQIADLGWQVVDTREGQQVSRLSGIITSGSKDSSTT